MVPLAAMLDSRDPEQFKAAVSAIAELANPKNRAFQVRALPMRVPIIPHVQFVSCFFVLRDSSWLARYAWGKPHPRLKAFGTSVYLCAIVPASRTQLP